MVDTPPHPASASLGHPLPAGERRFANAAALPATEKGAGFEQPPLPSGERVAERSGGRVRGRSNRMTQNANAMGLPSIVGENHR
jgi:hypothetical protein